MGHRQFFNSQGLMENSAPKITDLQGRPITAEQFKEAEVDINGMQDVLLIRRNVKTGNVVFEPKVKDVATLPGIEAFLASTSKDVTFQFTIQTAVNSMMMALQQQADKFQGAADVEKALSLMHQQKRPG